MHIGLAEANGNMGMAAHVRTYRNFAALVNYFIGAAVFLPVRMAIIPT